MALAINYMPCSNTAAELAREQRDDGRGELAVQVLADVDAAVLTFMSGRSVILRERIRGEVVETAYDMSDVAVAVSEHAELEPALVAVLQGNHALMADITKRCAREVAFTALDLWRDWGKLQTLITRAAWR